MIRCHNIFNQKSPLVDSERFTTVIETNSFRVESICSWMNTPGEYFDQNEDEWVVLITGEAILEIEEIEYPLIAGDSIFLPKHTRHRVISTSQNAVWIGVFSS